MVKVYRVEHKRTFQGPYTMKPDCDILSPRRFTEWKKFRNLLHLCHGDEYTHPGFDEDMIREAIRINNENLLKPFKNLFEFISGFRTLDQLYQWFDGFEKDLKKFGFVIAVYEVSEEDIIDGVSGTQIAFVNPMWHSIDKIPIDIKRPKINQPVRLFGRQTKTWSDEMVD